MSRIVLILIVFCFLGCKKSVTNTSATSKHQSKLIKVFRASKGNYPFISVHRGGKGLFNYPENCLETLQYINDSISAIYEIDVAQTKDGQLVLMHDNSINRTTTGSGLVRKLTYDELLDFNLVDDFGTVTTFKVPLFSEVLKWSKQNNVILTIDIKRSVNQKLVIKAIKDAGAEDNSIIITYDVSQAKTAYKLAPDLLLSVSARNNDEIDRLMATNIPIENMLAFTGTRLSEASLYNRLKEKDIVTMLGTLGNLDKQAKSRGDELYKKWKDSGIDIIATDRPFEAFNAIFKLN